MIPWDKLHGAMTHFPIALLLFSTACDFVSVAFKKLTFVRGLRLVSFYGLAVAALASLGAVVSGIALTKGDMWGRGDFGWHHRFVWPAFGLLVALAVWRLVVRDAMSRTGLCLYLILMLLASGFVAAAGYFGGELLLSGGVCRDNDPSRNQGRSGRRHHVGIYPSRDIYGWRNLSQSH
jgi:uncharacterized membrane protein